MKFGEIIRDPLWQFIGTLASLLALIVAIWPIWKASLDEPTVNLCRYARFAVFSSDPAPEEARERLKLIYKDKELPPTELFVSQFCLTNRSGRTIAPQDFVQPVTLETSENIEVIYIRTVRQDENTAVGTAWKDIGNRKFVMEPTVLNRDETLWFQLLYRVLGAKPKNEMLDKDIKWQALFRGAKFIVGDEQKAGPLWFYLQIKHQGLGVYLFVFTGLIFSTLLVFLLGERFSLVSDRKGAVIGISTITCFGWAVSEIAVDSLYNEQTSQPWVAWLFVISIFCLICIALFHSRQHLTKYKRKPRSSSP